MSFTKSEEVGENQSMSNGSLVKNGFFNYLRDFCQRNSAMSWPEIAREGARSWRHLSEEEKSHYQIMSSTDTAIVAMHMDNEMCNHPMGRMGGGMKEGKSCAKPSTARARQKKSCSMQRRKMACGKPKIRAVCFKPRKAACAKPRKSACAKPRKAACSKPRKSACARPRKSECESNCTKPGPVTNNGYLNFVREFRKRNCDLKPQELIAKAARAWQNLSEENKNRYRRMACRVTTSSRHKRRRVCKIR
ncbi:histone-like protein 18C [Drosophila gunungcola]|uniref:histone-like protein 18C n=1 Tax=Drosophila gunungcola TaxID=103775 RepID=UPI0022DF7B20|nr:histone-like protein 18C [Drosophila gunungcola]